MPNPCLPPLEGGQFTVKIVVSDLGSCSSAMTDAQGRGLTEAGEPIRCLHAQGNAAANIFGEVYPGAGATMAPGLVGASESWPTTGRTLGQIWTTQL
ncbi:FAD-binding protein [Helcobacillus massiliensis]|uniref:FAD-binding protein n=1 Tax=Helcobacillus massiliensis TaxID=521392 RepID=UPI00160A07BD